MDQNELKFQALNAARQLANAKPDATAATLIADATKIYAWLATPDAQEGSE